MPSWKKVITSGSNAAFNSLTVSSTITGSISGSLTGSLFGTASWAYSASQALTASYALNAGGSGFPFSGSAIITGSLLVSQSGITVTGSVSSTGGFTGSLFGTSSWAYSASQALTASYAQYTNYVGFNYTASFTNQSTWNVNHNLNHRFVLIQVFDNSYNKIIPSNIELVDNNNATISFPTQESGHVVVSVGGTAYVNLLSASYASTASYINPLNQHLIPAGPYTNNTSSYDLGSPTAAWRDLYVSNGSIKMISGSNSASIQFNDGIVTFTGAAVALPSLSTVPTSSISVSSSYASTASYVQNAVSASYVQTAQTASYVLNAVTASYINGSVFTSTNQALSASYSLTASFAPSYVLNSATSSFVLNSATSSFVLNSATSSFATTGTNNFNGNQTITGSRTVLHSLATFRNGVTISGSLIITGSTTETGPLTVNGTTTVTGSLISSGTVSFPALANASAPNITFIDSTGNLTYATTSSFASSIATSLFNLGVFTDTTTQSGSANVSSSFQFNTTSISNGVTLTSGSRLNISTAGTYNIQYRVQAAQGSGASNLYIWFKKNGVNIADSSTFVIIPSQTTVVVSTNIVNTAAVGDYYELVKQFSDANTTFPTTAAAGNIPRSPGVIVTVTQVR
jgi:hypothetical protein